MRFDSLLILAFSPLGYAGRYTRNRALEPEQYGHVVVITFPYCLFLPTLYKMFAAWLGFFQIVE